MQPRLATSLEEVEGLRSLWDQTRPTSPDADLDYFSAVVSSSPEVLRPHVVVLERPGRAPAIAVGRLEEGVLELKVGYRVVARPRLRQLVVVYGGLLGCDTEAERRAMLHELRETLREGTADVLLLAKLRTDGALYELARELAPWACRDHLLAAMPRTDVAVPDDIEAFMQGRSRKARDNVRRYGKRLERDHGSELVLRAYRAPDELDEALGAMEAVAAKTYQRGLGVGFRDEPRQRVPLEAAARKGMFRAWVLSLAGEPVAFWHGVAYEGTFHTGTPGYDPAYGKERIGQYVRMRMMEDLCADPSVQRLDYGFGDAEYKRSFGDRTWTEADVMMFAPRAKALGVNAIRTGVGGATRTAKRTLGAERVAALRRRARHARTQPA